MSSDVAEEKTGSEPALDKAPSFKRTRRPTTPPKTHSIAPPTVPPMFGSLIKLGHRMPTWKERHFVLVDGHVGYYDVSGGGKKLKGEFTLTSDSEMVPSTKRPHAFTVKSSGIRQKGHSFTFAAGDEATKEAWIAAFEAHIEFVRAREALDMDRVDYAFPS